MQSKMKKVLTVLLLSALCTVLSAGPADPKPFNYTQPDGSVVRFFLHGDEHLNWMTKENGEVIEIGKDGYIRPGHLPSDDSFKSAARRRSKAAATPRRTGRQTGERHFIVVLVGFSDCPFTKTTEQYEDFFNGRGAGSTGSVRDYYIDQSDGKFQPYFDIYGPVAISESRINYKESPKQALAEALSILVEGEELNLGSYVTTYGMINYVEDVIMIFAGHSRASGDTDGIWPCRYSGTVYQKGNNIVGSFCCAPELQGKEGTTIAGIGHICHEFGHCMGLPDIYDTNKSSHSTVASACLDFSLMDQGCHNNKAKTPPPMSMMEKSICGWVNFEDIPVISESGSITLNEIGQRSGNRAYIIPSDKDGECFIGEYRSNNSSVNKWGASLPRGGLLIFHLDKSDRSVQQDNDTETAANWWPTIINNNGSHPLYYIVPSGDQTNLECTDQQKFPFPGSQNIVSYTPISWNNTTAYVSLTGITYNAANTSMTLKAHVRAFPIINNPRKGIYSSTSQLTLKLSPGSEGTETVSDWYLDKVRLESTEARPKVDISAGSHTIEAVLQSGKKLRLDIIAQ